MCCQMKRSNPEMYVPYAVFGVSVALIKRKQKEKKRKNREQKAARSDKSGEQRSFSVFKNRHMTSTCSKQTGFTPEF